MTFEKPNEFQIFVMKKALDKNWNPYDNFQLSIPKIQNAT